MPPNYFLIKRYLTLSLIVGLHVTDLPSHQTLPCHWQKGYRYFITNYHLHETLPNLVTNLFPHRTLSNHVGDSRSTCHWSTILPLHRTIYSIHHRRNVATSYCIFGLIIYHHTARKLVSQYKEVVNIDILYLNITPKLKLVSHFTSPKRMLNSYKKNI